MLFPVQSSFTWPPSSVVRVPGSHTAGHECERLSLIVAKVSSISVYQTVTVSVNLQRNQLKMTDGRTDKQMAEEEDTCFSPSTQLTRKGLKPKQDGTQSVPYVMYWYESLPCTCK